MRLFYSTLTVSLLLFPSFAAAQMGSTAELSGIVFDPSGLVAGVQTIILHRTDTGQSWTAKTSEAGEYRFPELAPGRYELETKAGAFAALRVAVELTVDQQATFDLHLKLAETRQRPRW